MQPFPILDVRCNTGELRAIRESQEQNIRKTIKRAKYLVEETDSADNLIAVKDEELAKSKVKIGKLFKGVKSKE